MGTLVFTTGSLLMRFALPSVVVSRSYVEERRVPYRELVVNAPRRGQLVAICTNNCANYLFRVFEKLGVSNRFELLFLLFKECNGQATGRVGTPFGTEIGNSSIEAYLKCAEEGVVAAQFVVGLAHIEGYCAEKNGLSAYYWLRMAEQNSCRNRQPKPGPGRRASKHAEENGCY